jgi:hypothetical protein
MRSHGEPNPTFQIAKSWESGQVFALYFPADAMVMDVGGKNKLWCGEKDYQS